MTSLLLQIVSSAVGVALTLLVGYLLYLYRRRVAVSVELVTDTRVSPLSVDVVVTNHGRSPVVITSLDIHIPVESVWDGILAETGDGVPAPKMSRFLKLRRKLRTNGSRNDALALAARAVLPHRSLTSKVIGPHETIRVEPQEKVARPFPLKDTKNSPWYMPHAGELSNPTTFVPSCKVANHKPLIWGPPTIIGRIVTESGDLPMVMGMNWR